MHYLKRVLKKLKRRAATENADKDANLESTTLISQKTYKEVSLAKEEKNSALVKQLYKFYKIKCGGWVKKC